MIMATTSFLTNCPRCGYVAEAWTEDGVNVRVRCKMCGYEGWLQHPDLKNGAWRVG
jgi:ribosomal protein S27AE